mmetsp:Transcript_16626/g.21575  ORF Transcript_16626/g.21575 Transcript_16626/m.21575 type:complete len:98 (-) Transcript_16626:67-360(-)
MIFYSYNKWDIELLLLLNNPHIKPSTMTCVLWCVLYVIKTHAPWCCYFEVNIVFFFCTSSKKRKKEKKVLTKSLHCYITQNTLRFVVTCISLLAIKQ